MEIDLHDFGDGEAVARGGWDDDKVVLGEARVEGFEELVRVVVFGVVGVILDADGADGFVDKEDGGGEVHWAVPRLG